MTTLRSQRKNIFTQLLDKGALSADSVSCLIQTLDPFHDTAYKYVGLPDTRNDHSVVQVVKKTLTIVKPPEITSDTWDLHICTLPERNAPPAGNSPAVTCPFNVTTLNEEGMAVENPVWGNVENFLRLAPIVMTMVPSGNVTWPTATGDVPSIQTVRRVISLNDYFAGNSRIIGGGMEVHNVTPALTKKGTVTVYRQPQTFSTANITFIDRTSAADVAFVGMPQFTLISRLPPSTPDQALILPHSKQWDAAFGSYQVFTTDFAQPDTTQFGNRHFGYYDFNGGQTGLITDGTPLLAGATYGVSRNAQTTNYAAAPLNTRKSNYPSAAPFKLWPVDTTGAFYTGLGVDTTLTVTVIFIIETFPTSPSPLVTLAQPPPAYDPMFFKIYKDIALTMPPGVMVAENASGDWWEKVLRMAGSAASFIPGFGALGSPLAELAIKGIDKFQSMSAEKKAKEASAKAAAKQSSQNAGASNVVYAAPTKQWNLDDPGGPVYSPPTRPSRRAPPPRRPALRAKKPTSAKLRRR